MKQGGKWDFTQPVKVTGSNDVPYLTDPAKVAEQANGWDEVMQLAKRYGLIAQAYAGVAVLIHPHEAIREGLYFRMADAAGHRDWLTPAAPGLKGQAR